MNPQIHVFFLKKYLAYFLILKIIFKTMTLRPLNLVYKEDLTTLVSSIQTHYIFNIFLFRVKLIVFIHKFIK